MLYLLVSKIEEYNMEIVKGIEKIGRISEMERIKKIRGIEDAIGEIK